MRGYSIVQRGFGRHKEEGERTLILRTEGDVGVRLCGLLRLEGGHSALILIRKKSDPHPTHRDSHR